MTTSARLLLAVLLLRRAAPAVRSLRLSATPGSQGLGLIKFSPDSRHVTYLRSADGSLTRQMYAYDRETGEVRQVIAPSAGGGEEQTFSNEEQFLSPLLKNRTHRLIEAPIVLHVVQPLRLAKSTPNIGPPPVVFSNFRILFSQLLLPQLRLVPDVIHVRGSPPLPCGRRPNVVEEIQT